MLRFAVLSLVLLLASAPARSGSVTPADMTASAQMQVENGVLSGCGLRVVAVASDGGSAVFGIDFSFNIYSSGLSLVKAGFRAASTTAPKPAPIPAIKAISDFWIKTAGVPGTTPDKTGIAKSASPKGYLFYATSMESVSALFAAAFDKQPMQVGVRLVGEDIDRIFSGVVKDPGSDFAEVSRCLSELTQAMEDDIAKQTPKPK